MKDLSLSWIDRADLDASLSRAGIASSIATGASTGRTFWRPTGSTAPQPETAPTPPQAVTSEMTRVRPQSTYEPTDAPLGRRLEDYLRWVSRRTGSKHIFIADADGLVIMEMDADPDVVGIASLFVSALNQVASTLSATTHGSICVDLAAGESLHVVQAETGLGLHALGFSVSTPAQREVVDSTRDGLVRVMSPIPDEASLGGRNSEPTESL